MAEQSGTVKSRFQESVDSLFPAEGGAAVALDAVEGGNPELLGLGIADDRIDRTLLLTDAALHALALLDSPAFQRDHGQPA
jgi:hypothetical protein